MRLGGEQTLSTLATLLAVEELALERMLTQRVVVTRGETFTKQLGLNDANLTRDAIVKSLYEVCTYVRTRCFDWLETNKTNPWKKKSSPRINTCFFFFCIRGLVEKRAVPV